VRAWVQGHFQLKWSREEERYGHTNPAVKEKAGKRGRGQRLEGTIRIWTDIGRGLQAE